MIKVNGKDLTLEGEMTLADLLSREGYKTERIAVELNGEIIKKARYSEVILHDGDIMEVVSFVGGG